MNYSNAHAFYEKHLLQPIADMLRRIHENIPSDLWLPKFNVNLTESIQVDHQSRDGYISHNNGGAQLVYFGDVHALVEQGHQNPHIKRWIKAVVNSLKDDVQYSSVYLEWLGSHKDCTRNRNKWLETSDGEDFWSSKLEMEESPFLKVKCFLQATDYYKHDGEVTPDTELLLRFSFNYNDDIGYGRDWTTCGGYCRKGIGDRQKVDIEIKFRAAEVDWLLTQIRGFPRYVESVPDKKEVKCPFKILSPSLMSHKV